MTEAVLPEIITRKQARELGLKFYYTGSPCKHKHICKRHTSYGHCIECNNIKSLNQSIIPQGIMRRSEVKKLRKECGDRGLKTYFTGNKCKHGHRAERYVANMHCVECEAHVHLIMSEEKFDKYKKKRAKRQLVARIINPLKVREQDRINYIKYKDKILKQSKKYYKNNRERAIRNAKKWQEKNRDRFLLIAKKSAHTRRARKLASFDSFSTKQINEMFAKQKGKCGFCFSSIRRGYHIDHIQPLSKGGDNGIKNIQLLCRKCNLRKSAKDPIKWAQENGRLL